MNVECKSCYFTFEVEEIIPGEIVVCPDCGANLEVTSIDPIDVLVAEMDIKEDWGE